MKKVKTILVILIVILIVSCSNDQHENYIGKYEYRSMVDGNTKIMEIYREENIFFVKEENKNPIPTEKVNEGLKVNGILISLSKDNKTLYFRGQKGKRVSDQYAKKILEKKKNEKDLCAKLNKESKIKNQEVSNKEEWNKYVDDLVKRKPENCILTNAGKRWL